MTPVTDEQFEELLGSFTREAIHLETRDAYGTDVELPHMAQWARGETDDLEWLQGWCAILREHVAAGKSIRRARIVSEPLSEYQRWSYSISPCLEMTSTCLTTGWQCSFCTRETDRVRAWSARRTLATSGCADQRSRRPGSCRYLTVNTNPSSSARQAQAEPQIPDLIATARVVESAYLEFRRQARAGMRRVLGAHTVSRYARTSMFRIYEHNAIPGLFQTVAYSTAMLSFWIKFLEVPNDIEAAVAARMERRRVLLQGGKQFFVVLEEQALRTWFGDDAVQEEQLAHLLDVMSMPAVSFGINPMMIERTAIGSAGFWIFDNSLVALETPTASLEVTRPQEIELYARMFEHLKAAAVYGPAARTMIIRALGELPHRKHEG